MFIKTQNSWVAKSLMSHTCTLFVKFPGFPLHGLFQAGSTRGGGGHKVPAAFLSETVKATAIKPGTLTN